MHVDTGIFLKDFCGLSLDWSQFQALLPQAITHMLCLYNFVISRMFCKWNHVVYELLRLLFNFFHSALVTHLSVSVVRSFLLLRSSPLCGCTTICLSILLMDIWKSSSLKPWWIKLLHRFVDKSFCRHTFSFLLGKYVGVGLMDEMVVGCLTL